MNNPEGKMTDKILLEANKNTNVKIKIFLSNKTVKKKLIKVYSSLCFNDIQI